jgi:serine/threonine protein kinase/tetratricopeptide (TPR) repeat protein
MSGNQVIANRYEIIRTIGQGGMGDVYLGQDRQTGQTVAIKLLKPDIVDADPSLVERFAREGEALRRLNHPNIVTMLDTVEEGGLHYLVMQYVGGGSLRDLLDREPVQPVERVLSIGIELADALTRAHHLQIIHRDLKPENVMLDEDGTPLLADFGVARLGTRTRVTVTGSVIGTYAYLSPEACMGEELDTRTDIWSFGVILWEMLAGQRPFASEQPTAILLKIMQEPVPLITDVRPDTPPALVELLNRMLQKDRAQRVPSVRLVGAALEAISQGVDTPFPFTPSQAGRKIDSERFATPTPPEREPSLVVMPTVEKETETHVPPTDASTTVPGTAASAGRGRAGTWALAALGLLALVVVAVIALAGTGGEDGDGAGASAPMTVAPVGPGEHMVLVADLEPLRGVDEHDVSRFIVEDLAATLEQEIPFSNFRIRAYPQVITSDAEAQAAAAFNDAAVIVWGNYTADEIEVEVQVGSLDGFPMIELDPGLVARTANTRVRLTDEREQSIAQPVLNVFNVLNTAAGGGYEVLRLLVILDIIGSDDLEIVSGGVSAEILAGIMHYMTDTGRAMTHLDAAIEIDSGNPLPYMYRATGYIRLGEPERALQDLATAQRLGPDGWTAPLFLRGSHSTDPAILDESIALFDQIIARRPADWFAYNYRGALYYLQGDYEQARADLDQAIALGPTANFPYFTSLILAIRQGRWIDLQNLLQAVITQYPDPLFSTRTLQAIYGEGSDNVFGPMFAATGNLLLGQYDQAATAAQQTLEKNDQLADMYLAWGLALCNQGQYEAAEAAYSDGITVEPGHIALHALRAEVRLRLGQTTESLADADVVLNSELGDAFAPLLQAGISGEWSCETFFDFDYSNLETATHDE